MQIKAKQAVKRITYLKITYLCVVAFVVILVSNIGETSIAHAESFLRICKKGVIYYYFPNTRETNENNYSLIINRRISVNRPQVRQRLSAQELEPWIKWASRQHKLPASLIKAVIRVESNFNPAATSPKGAQGLMQLMPETAAQLQVTHPYDIWENIWGGARYLGMLLHRFNNNLVLALAAYNAGPRRVEQCQGIPPIAETQGFVRNVCANFLHYSKSPLPRSGSKHLPGKKLSGNVLDP
jgi:soluble lytic murein transglycosylase-like protein